MPDGDPPGGGSDRARDSETETEFDAERVDRLRERVRKATRSRAGASDGDAPDPETLDDLVARLGDDDPEERASAAWGLAELAVEAPERSWRLPVDTELAPLLADDDQWVRRGASWALATVADDNPERARPALGALADGLTDADPLVRENAVLSVSSVADEYPYAAEPVLAQLAEVVREEDGWIQQHAADVLGQLVRKLDGDGFPQTVAATQEFADLLPDDSGVVTSTDESDGGPVSVPSAGGQTDERDDVDGEGLGENDQSEVEMLGPPREVPTPPAVTAQRADLERLGDLGGDPLTTAMKARAPARTADDQGVVVAGRTLRSELGVDSGAVETAFRAWEGVDDHDFVLPVLARGTTPRHWIATEYADGGTLRDHVGRVGFDRGLWYAHCLATAVCHAHGLGVVHGGLRPGAVGLSQVLGAWPVPKVADWGLAEVVSTVRSPPVPAGFAAPEHVAPEEFGYPDPATDVYGLGALCYALFAGRPPYTGDSSDVARRVTSEEPEPPSAFAPGLPPAVDDLVERALTKEKRARFETAEDFRRKLEVILDDHGSSVEWER
ncbi:protein kinase domain-containing protein [Halorussus litoreus]|uniref:protein kinase domain-containing protein n=1 Tax=Halorussus litoreus TaxID=1710536 RepID=UPI000E25D77B|nr:HEAT repeat domain-containing protein [Halorussus litoreus]